MTLSTEILIMILLMLLAIVGGYYV